MKEIVIQLRKNHLVPLSEIDEEALKSFKQYQPIRAKLYGVERPRSHKQLSLYWKACKKVAENLDNTTKEEVDFDVKVRLKHIKQFRVVNGVTIVEVDSISYDRLSSAEANNFFTRAFNVLGEMIGVSGRELLDNLEGDM